MVNDKESFTVPYISIQFSVFPYAYNVKYINHYYLDDFPMACMFKFQNYHTAPFLTTGNILQKKQISAPSPLPDHKYDVFLLIIFSR